MADRLDGKATEQKDGLKDALVGLEKTVRLCCAEGTQELLAPELQTFLTLSRNIENVALSLDKEI